MAGRGRGRGKGRRDGLTLQLPAHVQNTLNKEDRLLQQTLSDLQRETKHLFKCISQDQQVAANKLRILEKRIEASKARSQSAQSLGAGTKPSISRSLSRKDTCSSDYFKSLLTPGVRDYSFSAWLDDEPTTSLTSSGSCSKEKTDGRQSVKKSSMKKISGLKSKAAAEQSGPQVLRKSVSFSVKDSEDS